MDTAPWKWLGLTVVLIAAAWSVVAEPSEGASRAETRIEQTFLVHPTEPERRVELYLSAPRSAGSHPAILFVHGHQEGDRPGGRFYVDNGYLERWAAAGVVAAAVSQPGYGASDGPPDFCGPLSRQAAHAALAALRDDPRVDPDRIVLFGRSRGAVVSSRAAVDDARLAGLVLRAGIYDMVDAYERLDPSVPLFAGIRSNIDRESGGTLEALRDRSVLHAAEPIRVPTMILHGEDDDRAPVAKARALAEALEDAGTPVELLVYPEVGHRIPLELEESALERFLQRVLGLSDEC